MTAIDELIKNERPKAKTAEIDKLRLRLAQCISSVKPGEEIAGIQLWRQVYRIEASIPDIITAIKQNLPPETIP